MLDNRLLVDLNREMVKLTDNKIESCDNTLNKRFALEINA